MKKLIASMIVIIFVVSMTFLSVSCKEAVEETAPAEEGVAAEKPFAGQTLTYLGIDWLGTQVLRNKVGEFEDMTGAKVEFDILDWSAFQEKLFLVLNSGSSTYDLVNLDYTWSGSLTNNDYLTPLPVNKWEGDPDFNFEDIFSSYIDNYGNPMGGAGNIYIVPFVSDIIGLYYRQDLFEDQKNKDEFEAEYGYELKVPEYWNEFLDVAKFFTRDDLYGTAMMAAPVGIASDYVIYANGFGFDYFTDDLHPDYLQPLSIEATQFYIDLWAKWEVVPKSTPNNWYSEVSVLMQKGELATVPLWAAFNESINDPESTDFSGKIKFAPLPKREGMEDSGGLIAGHGLAIPKFSEHQEAALAFVEWVLSKDFQDDFAMQGATGARYSSLKNAASKYPWMSVYADAVSTGEPWTKKIFPDYTNVHNVVMSEELSKALVGQLTVEEALKNVQNRVLNLMIEAGYYTE